jgi:hypothetical protein
VFIFFVEFYVVNPVVFLEGIPLEGRPVGRERVAEIPSLSWITAGFLRTIIGC